MGTAGAALLISLCAATTERPDACILPPPRYLPAEEEEGSEEEEEESGDEEMSGSEGEEEEDEMSGSEGDDMAGGSSDEEGEGDEEEEAGGTAAPAAPADPFSRKQLQQKAAAAAAAAATPQDAQQPARPPPEEGATVFIRGLPLDVSKEQVFLKLKVSGACCGCAVVAGDVLREAEAERPGSSWRGHSHGGSPVRRSPATCSVLGKGSAAHSIALCHPLSLPPLPTTPLPGLWRGALLPPGHGQGLWQAQGHRVCRLLQARLGAGGGRRVRQGQVRAWLVVWVWGVWVWVGVGVWVGGGVGGGWVGGVCGGVGGWVEGWGGKVRPPATPRA
mgnify:CR=1 FL=1